MQNTYSSEHSDIQTLALELFGTQLLAEEWFNTPIPALSGKKPCDLVNDVNGRAELRQILNKLKHGDFN
ncbi:antitoxin Xre/MbcA/ParS toxin-binding domain-containing protein [Vibrio maritimus]|uniref:antitoxin Xre/MbcA/ParS toxin-binding domain-containing protein n=1 Tax=Vibrio maritimus TaxID=990268 RepID=UPI004067DC94